MTKHLGVVPTQLVELSHTLREGIMTYPGAPTRGVTLVGIDSLNVDDTS